MAAAKKKGASKKKAAGAAKAGSKKKEGPLELHGLALTVGDVKKAAKGKATVVTMLPRSAIKIVKGFNPRSVLGEIDTLAASVKREGLINPVTVRPEKGKPGSFLCVAGERRLKALDLLGVTEVSATLRTDLEGQDARARAVAVAENSEDGRFNLNPIEIGHVVHDLSVKQKWPVARIAQETGLHAQKVRRCITLMNAPKDVQAKVSEGELSMIAGLELAKIDDSTRKKIKDALHSGMSAAEVKKLAKSAAKAAAAPKPGKSAQHQKGAARDAALRTWKGSKTKQAMLQQLSFLIVNSPENDVGTVYYHEMRGGVAALLWDRGDLETPFAPALKAEDEEDMSLAQAKKALKAFNTVVEAEAAKHTPETEDGEE